jgi:phage terminase large subunit
MIWPILWKRALLLQAKFGYSLIYAKITLESANLTLNTLDTQQAVEGVVEAVGDSPKPNYSKDAYENTRDRVLWLSRAANNKKLQAIAVEICRQDILAWVNLFVSTYDPRKSPSVVPFITYPYEDELILELVDRIKNQKDILVDKSRDMGVTWCVLLVFTWYWQFHGEGFDFLVGSRKEQYIDVMGNMDTLLEKVRFIIRNQPAWMRPRGFDFKSHSNYLKIVNPHSKSTITGEATNNNFSRGGRRRAIFLDEFAFWECDQAAWRASADSSNCRIVVSTPCGFNNQFAKLRHSGTIDHRSLHWRLHPEKDQAWYDNECKRRNYDMVEISQELDINYEGSEEGILFEFSELKKAVQNQPLESKDRIVITCDPSGEGEDEAVFYVSNNGAITERKFIKSSTSTQLAAEAILLINKYKAQVFEADSIGNDVCDIVSQLLGRNERGVKVVKFKSNEKALDPVAYYNRRDEVYHQAALAMKAGNVGVDDDYTLQRQLNATKYMKDNGRIYVTPKEEVKDMVKSSPDRADAWVLIADALRFTHSRREVEEVQPFRRRQFAVAEVANGEEYGHWGDSVE